MIDSISGFTTPTGFTMIHSEHNTTTNLRPEVVAFYKIAGGSEPAAYTSTATDFLSTAPMWKAVAVRVTGHDPTNPIQGHSGNSPTLATTSVTLPSLTTVVSNTLLVSAVTVRRSISSINVNPMTLQWFLDGTGTTDDSSNEPSLFGSTQVIPSAGSTGTRQLTWSGSGRAAGLIFTINPSLVNADLEVTMSVNPSSSHYFADTVNYTITATNLSNSLNGATGVVVTDLLPPGLGLTSHTASTGTTYTPATGKWNIGNLAKNESKTLTLQVTIVCFETNFKNVATIIGNEFDPNILNNQAEITLSPMTGGSNPCPIIANDDIANGLQGEPIIIHVTNNDKGEFDVSTLSITVQPINGTTQIVQNGIIHYLPNGNFTGTDQFTYRICNTAETICDVGTVYVTITEDYTSPCLEATRDKLFYLPFPENKDQMRKALLSAGSVDMGIGGNGGTTVRSLVCIKIPYPKTIIIYDHWEDGYEADITVPTQSTTQIWGDGDLSNGVAPGYPNDIIPPGGSIVFDQTFGYNDRNQAQIFYDGKDKILSSNNIFISKITGDNDRFIFQNVKTGVLDVSRFGKLFRVGIGEDMDQPTGVTAFRYVSLFIRAAYDSTEVFLDYDGDGIIDETKILNEGEVWFYDGTARSPGNANTDVNKSNDIKATATITATEPVGVDVLFGGIDSYGTRNLYILPNKFYSYEYLTPVHTTLSTAPVLAYFTNNLPDTITVNWKDRFGGSGSINVPGNGFNYLPLSASSGYHFKSVDEKPFTAMVVIDADDNGSAYDWAYPVIPFNQLTNYASIAWAPGSDNLSANYNPIWVTANEATTVYVKWNGNLTDTGPKISPRGLPYDVSYNINALQSLRIRNTITNDNSGTTVYTCGTPIVAVWGQDAGYGVSQSPGMDVGYVMQPGCLDHLIMANDDFEVTEPDESVVINVVDNDGSFLCSIDISSISIIKQPAHGSLVINGDGTITYTPNPGFSGDDSFEYSLCSEEYHNTCDIAKVTIKIRPCDEIAAGAGVNVVKGKVFLNMTPDDGTYDGDEPFVPGVQVDLYVDKNCDGVVNAGDNLMESVVTDASGRYHFNTAGDTYAKDVFDAASAQYNLNAGTINWNADWMRSDNNRITSEVDAIPGNSSNRALRFSGGGNSATRSLNFSNATSAALKFSFRKALSSASASKYMEVYLDYYYNGSHADLLYTIDGSKDDGLDYFYHDVVILITSGFNPNGSNTLRFVTSGLATNEYIFIDNVELIYLPACFITKVNPANTYGRYIASSLDTASYFFDGLGYCSANKYLGVLADIDAVDDSTTVTKDIPLIIDVLGNDKGNLNPATVIIMEEPSHGSVTVNPNGTITYTPNSGYTGIDSLKYQVCSIDDPNLCDIATVKLNVQCAYIAGKNIINGMVFGDIDLDGNFDTGEMGVANINVELYDNANNLIETKKTSSFGNYQFEIDCEFMVRDEFNTPAYNNNDGYNNWKTNWIESGEAIDSPTEGYIKIVNEKLRVSGNGSASQVSIQRSVDLSGYINATLTYDYYRSSFNSTSDWVDFEVSKDGNSFTRLKRYSSTSLLNSSETFDISEYIGPNTTIRIRESSSSYFVSSEYVDFDNIQIVATIYPFSVGDDFETKEYNRNDGNRNWKTNWVESGDPITDPATSGSIFITDNGQLRVQGNGNSSQVSIHRSLDLSNASVAVLSFSYVKSSFLYSSTYDWVDIEISKDGNNPFVLLKRIAGTAASSGYESIEINNAYFGANTTIRIIESYYSYFTSNEYVLFDNFRISYKTDDNYHVKIGTHTGYNLTTTDIYNVTLSGCGVASCSNNFGLAASDLQIVKEVDNVEPYINDNVIFTLTVTNNGPSDNTNVIVNDLLPNGFQWVSDDGSGTYNPSTGVWTIGNLVYNATVSLQISAKALETGNHMNIATVSGDLSDPNEDNNTSQAAVSPEPWADLAVQKVSSTNAVCKGELFTYTITITNNGLCTAPSVVVEDIFDPALDIISVTPNVGSWSAPNWTIASLNSGATATLIVTCKVNEGSSIVTLTNTATVRSDIIDPDESNNTSTITIDVLSPSLSITKEGTLAMDVVAPNDRLDAGDQIHYTFTVT
ncbi:MAG TPA: Ig-like domain-containing protein, partial [Bacteroidales bacterium]|nr:Ig-like domain-containing protein [Bacteroidales bacterium]